MVLCSPPRTKHYLKNFEICIWTNSNDILGDVHFPRDGFWMRFKFLCERLFITNVYKSCVWICQSRWLMTVGTLEHWILSVVFLDVGLWVILTFLIQLEHVCACGFGAWSHALRNVALGRKRPTFVGVADLRMWEMQRLWGENDWPLSRSDMSENTETVK